MTRWNTHCSARHLAAAEWRVPSGRTTRKSLDLLKEFLMGLFSGKKGETIFSEPLLTFFRHNPLPELFQQTEGLKDDRLLAIVTALIVEDRIDAVLGSFLPRYVRLTEKTEFTFSMKIALVEALG